MALKPFLNGPILTFCLFFKSNWASILWCKKNPDLFETVTFFYRGQFIERVELKIEGNW